MVPVLRNGLPFSTFAGSPFGRFDALFNQVFGDEPEVFNRQGRAWSHMPLAMWQDENNLYIEAEMPGILEKDLEVTVHGDLLSIKALRNKPEGRKYVFSGRTFGRFERAVALPEAVETDQIEATLADGVLHLTLPKKAEARPRKIAVKNA
jgi:HSP20 family protein